HYPAPVHLTPAFAHLGHGRGDFPHAELAADRMLSLPLFPQITAAQQQRVVDALTDALR
ncbi:DegT/DnrJ/EryC1/StrS family aminotransferase, partial [Streptomyces vinaceus]